MTPYEISLDLYAVNTMITTQIRSKVTVQKNLLKKWSDQQTHYKTICKNIYITYFYSLLYFVEYVKQSVCFLQFWKRFSKKSCQSNNLFLYIISHNIRRTVDKTNTTRSRHQPSTNNTSHIPGSRITIVGNDHVFFCFMKRRIFCLTCRYDACHSRMYNFW